MENQNLGVLVDPRSPEAKQFDFKHTEIYTSSVPTYLTLQAARKYVGFFPADNQNGTSSCVAHGKVLVMSIFSYLQGLTYGVPVQLSSMFIYRNRVNYPGEGMIPASANMQTIKGGAPIYADMPTPATEADANNMTVDAATTKAAKLWATGKWVQLIDPKDIDTIAYVSNNLKLPLNILIYSTYSEWAREVVDIVVPGLKQSDPQAKVQHCVTVLPESAYLGVDGKKYVIIQDSALFGGFTFRSVSEEFIAERCTEADYMIAMGSAAGMEKPHVTLTEQMAVGAKGPQVLALQQCLQYMGYLPNVVNGAAFAPTSFFGGMTKNAVLKFQNDHAADILIPNGLSKGNGYCGEDTRAFINKLFV